MAAVADLVDADRHQPFEPGLVEVIGDDSGDDRADRVPADPQQASDRCERHLLRQPRHDVLEVARVRRTGTRPRHGLQAHAAVPTSKTSQLGLNDAPTGAEIEMPPALDAAVMHLEAAGLPAAAADPAPARERDRHDHALAAKRDVAHAGAGQAQQALECGGDAHVALLCEPLAIRQPAASRPGAAARRLRSAQPPKNSSNSENPAHKVIAATPSPPNRAETLILDRFCDRGTVELHLFALRSAFNSQPEEAAA